MSKKNTLTFITKKNNNKKPYLLLFFIILVFGSLIFYEGFSYKLMINNFTTNFDNNNFSIANHLLVTSEKINLFKPFLIEKDLNEYFSNKISTINSNLTNGLITEYEANNVLFEISRYNIINVNNLNKDIASTKYNYYSEGVKLFNDKNYIESFNTFSKVTSSDSNYDDTVEYLKKCKANIKANLLNTVDDLCNNNYYTKSLEEIEKLKNILGNDADITNKITAIKSKRSNYLTNKNSETQAASSSIINNFNSNTINTLSIESLTPYLIHVDLSSQKTNIYNGKKNDWTLSNSFNCSTGLKTESTPKGIYTIKEKGEWFFSEKYQQGGKYWVQFYGDYLFHSLPYDQTKTTIVDYTLGTPSSHGCIRLEEKNAKWVYDNIPPGSKVIIN